MKNAIKKLSLKLESIRQLGEMQLRGKVRGGYQTENTYDSCGNQCTDEMGQCAPTMGYQLC
jgi:hypothetical protein